MFVKQINNLEIHAFKDIKWGKQAMNFYKYQVRTKDKRTLEEFNDFDNACKCAVSIKDFIKKGVQK